MNDPYKSQQNFNIQKDQMKTDTDTEGRQANTGYEHSCCAAYE